MAKRPVSSFGRELLELYKQAAQEEKIIKLSSVADAYRLRARLYALRVAMRDENHPLLMLAETVCLYIPKQKPKDDPEGKPVHLPQLIAKPADVSFIEALREAGVEIEEADEDEGDFDEVSPVVSSKAEDILKEEF